MPAPRAGRLSGHSSNEWAVPRSDGSGWSEPAAATVQQPGVATAAAAAAAAVAWVAEEEQLSSNASPGGGFWIPAVDNPPLDSSVQGPSSIVGSSPITGAGFTTWKLGPVSNLDSESLAVDLDFRLVSGPSPPAHCTLSEVAK